MKIIQPVCSYTLSNPIGYFKYGQLGVPLRVTSSSPLRVTSSRIKWDLATQQ